jgi:hypothetical protein
MMRVDMLAIALSLFGLLAVFKSLERPRLIYVAALLFVAAVYTRQTAIAAPAASFIVLIAVRPMLAARGMAACLVLGLAALLTLDWLTGGGFHRHIFFYNVNRPDLSRLPWILFVAAAHGIYVVLAGSVLIRRLREVRSKYLHQANARTALGADVADTRLLIAAAYVLVSMLMLVLIAKSGSNINYFLEWFFALGLFTAMAPSEARKSAPDKPKRRGNVAVDIPILLAVAAVFTSLPRFDDGLNTRLSRELAQLSAEVAATQKPVVSDDMVLLIRGGHDVVWEPAIFAELASTGVWDERPFIERIRNHEFAFFITWGDRGDRRFGERYNPAVVEAMDAAYPVRRRIAGKVLHLPREQGNVR